MDTALSMTANAIDGNSGMVLLVALGALGVALALSFVSRFAFWILGILGTVAALWILVNQGGEGLILSGILLVGGWVGGYIAKGMIKLGAVLVTAFAGLLVWLQQWAGAHVGDGWMYGGDTGTLFLFAGDYVLVGAVLALGLVLAMPTILGKILGTAVKTVIPGGGDKKEKQKPAPEMKR